MPAANPRKVYDLMHGFVNQGVNFRIRFISAQLFILTKDQRTYRIASEIRILQ